MANGSAKPDGIYPSIDDWLYEIENYGFRAERMPPEAELWVRTAWRLAARAEAWRCLQACRTLATDPATPPAARDLLMRLSDELRASAPSNDD